MSAPVQESLALARVKEAVGLAVPRMLEGGSEPTPHFLLGWPERTLVCNLPPDRRAWGPFLLAIASALDAQAVAVVFPAWLSHTPGERPSQAGDRRNAAWVGLAERGEARLLQMGWTYSLDTSRREGQPGYVFDVQPCEMPADMEARSPHFDPLLGFWRGQGPKGRNP